MPAAPWWKRAVFYHIYPLSFQDTTGNGMGDLQGIIQRLDYLRELGVDALWISPCFPSPMADWGYDVSDYTDIHPDLGSLAAWTGCWRPPTGAACGYCWISSPTTPPTSTPGSGSRAPVAR